MPGPGSVACPKPPKREKHAPRRIRSTRTPTHERDRIAEIRTYVQGRERGMCRCCRIRPGDSMHELRPRSLGGKISKRNSVWVCGDGVNGCHGMLQRHEMRADSLSPHDAEGVLLFAPMTRAAADWSRIKFGEQIESAPMSHYEQE